jgi:hypothetical protein
VKVGVAGSVFVLDELLERGFLFRRALEEQEHARCGECIEDDALIVFGLCQGMDVASQGDALASLIGCVMREKGWGCD